MTILVVTLTLIVIVILLLLLSMTYLSTKKEIDFRDKPYDIYDS